jgi:phytanoyl-CoA hydroxylase
MTATAPTPVQFKNPIVLPHQKKQFEEQGFFVTDVLFDDATIAGVRAAFEQAWENEIQRIKTQAPNDTKALDLARTRPFVPRLDHIFPACKAFLHHPTFLQIAQEMIGPDIDQGWNQAIIKAPLSANPDNVDTAFGWHQDQWYAQRGAYAADSNWDILVDPDNSITCWVAITRTFVDNGTLWVLPGRHKEGLFNHLWNEKNRDWHAQIDTSMRIPAVLKPGQALIFKKFLPHASGPNISSEPRMAYQFGYGVPGLKKGPSADLTPVVRNGKPIV